MFKQYIHLPVIIYFTSVSKEKKIWKNETENMMGKKTSYHSPHPPPAKARDDRLPYCWIASPECLLATVVKLVLSALAKWGAIHQTRKGLLFSLLVVQLYEEHMQNNSSHIASNSSIRCFVLPCRICRRVLYLSRPALTFSAWRTSFCVFLVSSLAWANSELKACWIKYLHLSTLTNLLMILEFLVTTILQLG